MGQTLVLGAGRSALGAVKLLIKQGHKVLVSDIEEKFPAALQDIRATGARVIIGPQGPELLTGIDQIIVSPGLSPRIPILQAARDRGVRVLSEIDIALEVFSGQVFGVTGTNGKSTTTLLLAHFLNEMGIKTEASGNIGVPPSLLLAENREPKAFALELSSYQLDFSRSIPNRASLFMSFAPDHLERHGTMENYFAAKWKLILATAADGLTIMPRKIVEAAIAFQMPAPAATIVQILEDDEDLLPFGRSLALRMRGTVLSSNLWSETVNLPESMEIHNRLNVAAALAASGSKKPAQLVQSLTGFTWLPFRFERIGSIRGEAVYNDSKSTNVESTLIALRSLSKPALLMLGGHSKGESFEPILACKDRIGKLIVFGAARDQIAKDLAALRPQSFPTLREALNQISSLVGEKPMPLVFSPANASFDEFKNFEERGAVFNQFLSPLLDPKK